MASSKAEAPEIISINSVVIAACLVLLYKSVNFCNISEAFFEDDSIDCILDPNSEVLFSANASVSYTHLTLPTNVAV